MGRNKKRDAINEVRRKVTNKEGKKQRKEGGVKDE